jgi:hypothetical protein
MAETYQSAADTRRARTEPPPDSDRGAGWVSFAGVILALVGTMNVIYGIAAIADSRFYIQDAAYILSDLNAYGWLLLCVGVVQVAVAFGIWAGTGWGRWLGIASAGVNAIVQLAFIAAFPLAALALFTLDILVIYGLVAYGGRRQTA